jgi:hypothetical protein
MMSDLLGGIVGQVAPPFTLAKLEGDAAFAFAAEGDDVPRADAMLDRIRDCYADFRRRVGSATQVWTCRCDACSKIDLLDLASSLPGRTHNQASGRWSRRARSAQSGRGRRWSRWRGRGRGAPSSPPA